MTAVEREIRGGSGEEGRTERLFRWGFYTVSDTFVCFWASKSLDLITVD